MKTKTLITAFFVSSCLLVSFATAQYYDPYNYNYNYNQPTGVTTFNGNGYGYNYGYYDNNYYYNNNNCYYYNNCYNSNYNYNYNYNYSYLTATTYAATNVSTDRATINGYVTLSNNSYNNYYNSNGTTWFQYGTNPNNLDRVTNPAQVYGSTSINSYLSNLACGQIYYFRAVAQGQNGMTYGSTLSFSTPACYNYYSNYYPYYNYGYNNYGGNFETNCSKKRKYWR
jgi:hypothetical protein